MAKPLFPEKRFWLVASAALAMSYYLFGDAAGQGLLPIVWKGTGVGLLAVYALLCHDGTDARPIAAVMALSAAGDMAIEWDVTAGGACFLLSHITAITFYLRHRCGTTTFSQRAAAAALLLGLPVIGFLLPDDRNQALLTAIYGLGLGGMAAAAWISTFPRYSIGIGALLFVASDLLIFARMGPLARSVLPDLLIWPLYYAGQFLICTGVIDALKSRAIRSPPSQDAMR